MDQATIARMLQKGIDQKTSIIFHLGQGSQLEVFPIEYKRLETGEYEVGYDRYSTMRRSLPTIDSKSPAPAFVRNHTLILDPAGIVALSVMDTP